MTVVSVAALSRPELAKPGRRARKALVVVAVLLVVGAMLALFALRPIATTSGAGGTFAEQWTGATRAYAAETASLQQKAAAAQGGSASAVLGVYRDLAASTSRSVAAFEAIDPPAEAEAAMTTFVTLLKGEERILGRVIKAAEAGDTAALAVQIGELTEALVGLVAAREAVDRLAAA